MRTEVVDFCIGSPLADEGEISQKLRVCVRGGDCIFFGVNVEDKRKFFKYFGPSGGLSVLMLSSKG